MRLPQFFIPDAYADSIHSIDLEALKRQQIVGIICDLDNTLVPWDSDAMSPATRAWIQEVGAEFQLALVSNGYVERVERWGQWLDIPAVPKANKPRRGGFRYVLKVLDLAPDQVAVIGDQLFTDVVGGNRMGMHTILVRPLSRREFIGTRIVRAVERLVLRYLRWRGQLTAVVRLGTD